MEWELGLQEVRRRSFCKEGNVEGRLEETERKGRERKSRMGKKEKQRADIVVILKKNIYFPLTDACGTEQTMNSEDK